MVPFQTVLDSIVQARTLWIRENSGAVERGRDTVLSAPLPPAGLQDLGEMVASPTTRAFLAKASAVPLRLRAATRGARRPSLRHS